VPSQRRAQQQRVCRGSIQYVLEEMMPVPILLDRVFERDVALDYAHERNKRECRQADDRKRPSTPSAFRATK
jgi:hypothetical protein